MISDPQSLAPCRIALIKPSALGDIVHSLPVLSALRQRWPNAQITWVVNRSYASLLNGHPDLDAILPVDRAAFRDGPITGATTMIRLARRLHDGHFDLVIDLQGLLRTGLMCLATGAARRIGFANAREGAPWCYTDRISVPDADQIHAVDRYWRVVEAIGAGDCPKKFFVPIPDMARSQVSSWLAAWPRPWVVLGVGARWVTKRWPPHNFAALARRALDRFGGSVIFIGGSEDATAVQSVKLHKPALDLCGKTSLPQLAAVLERADVVLANDTGPLHLAAALGRPTIAPYTCTLVTRHGPYGQAHRTASAMVPCHGSYRKTCDHMSCLPTLPPERLFGLLDEVMSGWVTRKRA
ncbi:MAG: glycosyltransferase family 9 protein [Gemmataceae bacterium]